MRKSVLVVLISLVLLATCGCRPTNVGSPNGSVPAGSKAYSPDGKYYVTEAEPIGTGKIDVYKLSGQKVWSWDAIPYIRWDNVLKGMAWSSDSLRVAIMYHGGAVSGSGIYVFEIFKQEMIAFGQTGGYYHAINFDSSGTSINLPYGPSNAFVSVPLQFIEQEGETEGEVQNEGEPVVEGELPVESEFQQNSGVNLPWKNYGWDLGDQPWGGARGGYSANPSVVNSSFKFLADNGVRMVRVFLFCDLRAGTKKIANPAGGYKLEFDEYVYLDMNALLLAAKTHKLKLIPVLFDYTIADGVSEESGVKVGEHPELLLDDQEILITLMNEFLKTYGTNQNIYAWDIMNEPEYATAVNQFEVQDFITGMVTAVHENTDQLATVGNKNLSSMLQWPDLGLDLYQFHHYDSMGTDFSAAFPLCSGLGLDKPILIGELQPTQVQNKLQVIEFNGYQGALFWSLNSDYNFAGVAPDYLEYFQN